MVKINKVTVKEKVKEGYDLIVTHPRISYAIFLVIIFSLILLNSEY